MLLQERVDVPVPPAIDAELKEQVNPADDTDVNETVSVNPLIGAIVMVELPVTPTLTVMGVVAVIVKSGTGTVTVMVAVWVRPAETPVTLTR